MEAALQSKPLDALPENTCLFLEKGIDVSTEKTILGSIAHKSVITPYSTITFQTDVMDLSWLDLNRSFLEVTVKAVREDGNGSVSDVDFSCCNNLMHSLFSDVIVSINGTQVSCTNGTYPYVSLINALMDTPESERTYRTLALFKRDQAGFMNETRSKTYKVPSRSRISSTGSIIIGDGQDTDSDEDATGGSTTTTTTTTTTTSTSSTAATTATTDSSATGGQPTAPVRNKKKSTYKLIGGTNAAMTWRANFLKDGEEHTLIGKLDTDLFKIDR